MEKRINAIIIKKYKFYSFEVIPIFLVSFFLLSIANFFLYDRFNYAFPLGELVIVFFCSIFSIAFAKKENFERKEKVVIVVED